jgi:hypothetical protein
MDWEFPVELINLIYIGLALIGVGLLLSFILVGWVIWRVKKINLPPGAGFVTAIRATPFVVVLLLDLLDFSLDIFAAPFAWTLVSYLGLAPLRGVTVIESLIPGTQVIPTMTMAWLLVRLADRRNEIAMPS